MDSKAELASYVLARAITVVPSATIRHVSMVASRITAGGWQVESSWPMPWESWLQRMIRSYWS